MKSTISIQEGMCVNTDRFYAIMDSLSHSQTFPPKKYVTFLDWNILPIPVPKKLQYKQYIDLTEGLRLCERSLLKWKACLSVTNMCLRRGFV